MKTYMFIALFSFVLGLLFVVSPVLARTSIDENGHIVITDGQVLGDDDSDDDSDDDDDNSGSGSSGSSEDDDSDDDDDNSGSGSSGSSEDDDSDDDDDNEQETETEDEDGTRTKTEVRDDGEVRTEVRFPDGTKVKTRAEDDRTRTDVYQGGTKVRLERRGDRFRITAEDENGDETELGEDEIISIDERADKNQIRIRTFNSESDQLRNRVIIERLQTQAITDLPLSVDLETNELTVTTPAGEKTVTVLPDQAVQNMLAANVIDRIGGQALVDLVREGGVETLGQVIQLSNQDGVAVYEIAGVRERRLFGFFPIETEVSVTVSAETGEVLDTDQSLLDAFLEGLSAG